MTIKIGQILVSADCMLFNAVYKSGKKIFQVDKWEQISIKPVKNSPQYTHINCHSEAFLTQEKQ